MLKGLILLAIGVIGASFVYSLRPPDGLGDAIMMLAQGKEGYIEKPVFIALMSLFILIGITGLALYLKGIFSRKS